MSIAVSDAALVRARAALGPVRAYQLAALATLHPSRVSRLLGEREPLTPALAIRLHTCLDSLGIPALRIVRRSAAK